MLSQITPLFIKPSLYGMLQILDTVSCLTFFNRHCNIWLPPPCCSKHCVSRLPNRVSCICSQICVPSCDGRLHLAACPQRGHPSSSREFAGEQISPPVQHSKILISEKQASLSVGAINTAPGTGHIPMGSGIIRYGRRRLGAQPPGNEFCLG